MSEQCYRGSTSDCACLNSVRESVPATAHAWTVLQSQYQRLRMSETDLSARSQKIADIWQGILHGPWQSSRAKDNIKAIFGGQYRPLRSSLCSFFFPVDPVTSSLLRPIFPSTPDSQTPSAYVPPSMSATKFLNVHETRKYILCENGEFMGITAWGACLAIVVKQLVVWPGGELESWLCAVLFSCSLSASGSGVISLHSVPPQTVLPLKNHVLTALSPFSSPFHSPLDFPPSRCC